MGLIDTIKKRTSEFVKRFTEDPQVRNEPKTTFDFFIEEVPRVGLEASQKIGDFLRPPENRAIEVAPNVLVDPVDFVPIGSAGKVGRKVGRIFRRGVKKGLTREALQKITELPEKAVTPVKPVVKEVTKGLREFLVSQNNLMIKAADARNKVIGNDELVKIRPRGDGTITVTRGELDILKKMKDLKPRLSENIFQNPIRVFEELGSEAKELIYRPIKVAENLAARSKNFRNQEFDSVIKGLNQKSSERIAKFALSLEDDGAEILAKNKLKAEPLNRQEQFVFQFMRDRYDELLEQLNFARGLAGKELIKKRDNYFTHIKQLNLLEELGFNSAHDEIEKLIARGVHRNAPAFQFARKRVGGLEKVELDAFNVFRKYQEKAIDHIELTPAITKARELSRTQIKDPKTNKVYKMFDEQPRAYNYITEWLDHVAGQRTPGVFPKLVERTISKLNQNVAFATLAGNVRSAIIQPSAIINSITEIGVKNTLLGIQDLLANRGNFAIKNSNVLEGRQFETAIRDVAEGIAGKTGRIKQAAGKTGLKLLQVLDQMTAQATWLGAYNHAKTNLGLIDKEAFNYADDVVVRTQASAARSDVAKIQRSFGGRIATLFQTFVINDWNRLIRDVAGVGNPEMTVAQGAKKLAKYLTYVSLWNYVMEDTLGIPTPFPRPIKALKEEGRLAAATEAVSPLPLIGGAARFGSGVNGPLIDVFNQVFKKVSGKYTPISWWEAVGKLVGIPGTVQLKKTIKAVEGLEDGYMVTVKRGDKTRRIKIRITDPVDKVRALLFGLFSTKTAAEVRKTGRRPAR